MFDDEYLPGKPFCMYEYPVHSVIGRIKPFRMDKVILMKLRKNVKSCLNDENFPLDKKDEYIKIANKLKSDINDTMCDYANKRKSEEGHNYSRLKVDLSHNKSVLPNYGNSNFELKHETPSNENKDIKSIKSRDKKYDLLEEMLTKIDSDASFDSIILIYVCDMIVESGDTESELIKCLIDNAFIYRDIKCKSKNKPTG